MPNKLLDNFNLIAMKILAKLLNVWVFMLLICRIEAQPIWLHPENQHYFVYKGNPTVLVASSEHYGAVINPDFDFTKYLATLKSIGLNHTRIWLGDYVEVPGDFCIENNTSAPLPGKFLSPWKRSSVPGFGAGGNKFDLESWNPMFFSRLHAFMKEAEENNIIVECILFFVGPNWHLLPMNPDNNINNTTHINGQDYMTLKNGNILEYQKRFCVKMVNELNKYDNFFFNIANEPWFNNQEHNGFASPARDETKEWIREVSDWIVEEELKLPQKHLISVDYTNEGRKISPEEQEKYWKNISIFHHHYDKNVKSLEHNYGINKALSFNETGLMPPSTPQYRIQGWKYMMSGGALYNNLDFTFQVGYEDGTGGTEFICNGYNACSDKNVKFEMAALLRFMNLFDFINSKPNYNVIRCAWGDQNFYVLENPGKEYAIYIYGGSNKGAITLALLPGKYKASWINPSDGKTIKSLELTTSGDGNILFTEYPAYNDDLALIIKAL